MSSMIRESMETLVKQWNPKIKENTKYFDSLIYDAVCDLRAGRVTYAFNIEQVKAIQSRIPNVEYQENDGVFTINRINKDTIKRVKKLENLKEYEV